MTLTPSESRTAAAYRNFEYRRGRYPTLQQIADEFGVSKLTVFGSVQQLVVKGVMRHAAIGIGYELVPGVKLPDENRASKMPLIGSIS